MGSEKRAVRSGYEGSKIGATPIVLFCIRAIREIRGHSDSVLFAQLLARHGGWRRPLRKQKGAESNSAP